MNQTATFSLGQRWLSNTEMELGLGTVVAVTDRVVQLLFPATGEERNYAIKDSPLTRIRFEVGDTAEHHQGWGFAVDEVSESNGMLSYTGRRTDNQAVVVVKETFIAHNYQLNDPEQRLFSGQFDPPKWFELRKQCLLHQHRHLTSPLLGFVGARVSLIEHQLHIAREVGQRVAPRVLLADEVGLGKTIEAALIIHQQLLTGRTQRVLIAVPASLLHQWLVEMLRRVNLSFAIFDQERCQATEAEEQDQNPFETEQLVLCSLDFLVAQPKHFEQAKQAGWDLMVVDEAHHLGWSPTQASVEYQVVQALAERTKGVLLLTATPDQLGHESHFARLRLLDPDRFYDYPKFLAEEREYAALADAIAPLLALGQQGDADADAQQLTAEHTAAIERFVGPQPWLKGSEAKSADAVAKLIADLLDRHGTGRVLFRNSRSNIRGFPQRLLHSYPLDMPESYLADAAKLAAPETATAGVQLPLTAQFRKLLAPEKTLLDAAAWMQEDPRVNWFIEQLHTLQGSKVLTICAKASTALALAEAVRLKAGIRTAVFHEHLSIVERDKAANYFRQQEEGAQVLICSEIGSEGRNFQFAHHLVLLDLPPVPDLLEQRIGRLDRIGQTSDIHIHVPYFRDSAQQIMLNWYHCGLNAFENTCPTGAAIAAQVQSQLRDALLKPADTAAAAAVIDGTRELHLRMLQTLEQGRDRLLELNSAGSGQIEPFVAQICDSDDSPHLEKFMGKLLDTMGIAQEEQDETSYFLRPTESMMAPLPGLGSEGLLVTYEREAATQLEDVQFLSWDHPLVNNAMDLLLTEQRGKSAICLAVDASKPAGYFWLECLFVVTGHADRELQLHRFLPPTPIHFGLDAKQQVAELAFSELQPVKRKMAGQLCKALERHIRTTVAAAPAIAEQRAAVLIQQQVQQVDKVLGEEIQRLQTLRQVNPSIREDEISFLGKQQQQLLAAIRGAKVRLEAIRLIVNNP